MIPDIVAAVLVLVIHGLRRAGRGRLRWRRLGSAGRRGGGRGAGAVADRPFHRARGESNHVWLIIALVLSGPVSGRLRPNLHHAVRAAERGRPGHRPARGRVRFRSQVQTLRWQAVSGAVFALASLLTPFFLGTVIGAI